jgi:hypothetical protein
MNALVRKELRQILPAQLLVTALVSLAWFFADPRWALAPFAEEQSSLYVAVQISCLLAGLALGLGQFTLERWQGTEAYLVHRGTGRRGAFRAKVLAGLASLVLLAIVPPSLFGSFYLSSQDHAGSASVLSLVQAAIAGATVVPGYALGVFVAQVRRGWILRAALALLGAATLLSALTWLAHPAVQLWHIPFVGPLLAAAWLLFLAGREFETGERSKRSRPIALLRALTTAALCLPFFLFVPFFVRAALRIDVMAGFPHVVEDGQGKLFVATPTERDRASLLGSNPGIPRVGNVYELVDAEGGRVPDSTALHYNSWSSYSDNQVAPHADKAHFTTLYAPFWTPMTQVPEIVRRTDGHHPRGPLQLSGPWHVARDQPVGWHVLVDLSDGAVWVGAWSTMPRHRLATLGPSIRVLEGKRNSGPVLCDEATGLLRTLRNQQDNDELPVLEVVALPDGDRFVGVEPLYSVDAARIGVRIKAQGELLRGTTGLYVRDHQGWLRWEELGLSERAGRAPETELDELHRWSLVFSSLDGFGFHLDVLDAVTGDTRLAIDLTPTTQRQRNKAFLAELACLTFSPAVVLASWSSPRRVAPEHFGVIGPTLLDELRGRNRTGIVVASLLLAAALTRQLWRRLGQGGAPLELRLWWCGATALLGLPAYVLCRLLEPRAARTSRVAVARERREPRFVIRTA